MKRSVAELRDFHNGEDIFVLGSAASMDFMCPEFFTGRTTIGVNHVYQKFPCSYSVWKDATFDDVVAASSRTSVILSNHQFGYTDRPQVDHGDIQYWTFDHRMNNHAEIDWSVLGTDEIVVSYSTITSAIHLAAYMGARAIFLSGVDGGMLDGNVRYQGYPSTSLGPEQYHKWVRGILSQTLELRDRVFQVYGCRVYLLSPFLNFSLEGHKFEI